VTTLTDGYYWLTYAKNAPEIVKVYTMGLVSRMQVVEGVGWADREALDGFLPEIAQFVGPIVLDATAALHARGRALARYRASLEKDINAWAKIKRPTDEGKACHRDAVAALEMFDKICVEENA